VRGKLRVSRCAGVPTQGGVFVPGGRQEVSNVRRQPPTREGQVAGRVAAVTSKPTSRLNRQTPSAHTTVAGACSVREMSPAVGVEVAVSVRRLRSKRRQNDQVVWCGGGGGGE